MPYLLAKQFISSLKRHLLLFSSMEPISEESNVWWSKSNEINKNLNNSIDNSMMRFTKKYPEKQEIVLIMNILH